MNAPLADKPDQFAIAIRGKAVNVKRYFDFTHGRIDLDISFTPTTAASAMTVKEIHVASVKLALEHLQKLLDEANAKSPGQKK